MKNLIKLLAFTIVMLVGTSSMNAQSLKQDQDRPETIAKTETAKLNKHLDLTGEQQRAVFRALVGKEAAYKKYVAGKSSTESKAKQKKIDQTLMDAMRKALTKPQYDKWLEIKE